MNTSQWPPQEIVMKPIEDIVANTCPKERKMKAHKEQAINCPRCNSTNTKFCYYNNYSLSQPRYFCKTCRRYWTEGGSLRNIPVGGGSRKNKRSSTNSPKLSNLSSIPQNPNKISHNQMITQDLNLGFSSIVPRDFKGINELIQVPNFDQAHKMNDPCNDLPSSSSSTSCPQISALELLNGITASKNGFSVMPIIDPNGVYSTGFSFAGLKPSISFSLDGMGSNFENFHQEINGKVLFPYEDLNKQVNEAHHEARDKIGDSAGFWNGMMNGGGSW